MPLCRGAALPRTRMGDFNISNKSKIKLEKAWLAPIFLVPLHCQSSGGTTERVGSGRAAARHTLRKGSERDAERVGATCAKPRDNLPNEQDMRNTNL